MRRRQDFVAPPRIAFATLIVCLGLLVLGASPALAVRGHVFSHTFGSPGTGPGELKEPVGVAVNEETGMVYVAEKGNDRVQWFNSGTGKVEGEINGSGTLPSEKTVAGHGGLKNGSGEALEEETGQFSEPADVAVDNSCKLHHLKGKACEEYDPSNGDVYVVDTRHNVVDKYTANGEYIEQINAKTVGVKYTRRGYEETWWVAVEADGDVLVQVRPVILTGEEGVYRLSSAVHNVVLPLSGEPAGFTAKGPSLTELESALGVAGGRVFVGTSIGITRTVSVYGLNGQLLAQKFYEGGTANAGLAGESCGEDVYVDEFGEKNGSEKNGSVLARFSGSGEALESLSVPGGGGTGVAVDCLSSTASDVFVANFAAGEVDVFVPEPPGPPSVESGSGFVSEVSSGGARLSFVVNPRSEPGEVATSYWLEYGPCPAEGSCASAGYGQSVEGSLSASYEASTVSATVNGLTVGTRYHYRVRARNSHDPGPGEEVFSKEELTFTTQSVFAGGLLDGRGWELVSPPDKRGAKLMPIGEQGVVQAAADGGAVTYLATGATEADPASTSFNVQVLSRRTSRGWESCDVGLPHEYVTGPPVGWGDEYVDFTEDLGVGVAQPFGRFSPIISAEASEDTPYLVGLPGSCGQRPVARPLVSGCIEARPCEKTVEEHEDVYIGKPFGEEQECVTGFTVICGPWFEGANANLSAVVMHVRGSAVLVEETSEGRQVPGGALYEWDGGQLYVVSVLPSGQPIGVAEEGLMLGALSGSKPPYGVSLRGAVSEDGSRVVWSETGGETHHHLFVWDRASGKSAQVDVVQGGSGEGGVAPRFQFATADGSRVFFTDTQALTSGSASAKGNEDRELYECEVVVEEAGPKCVLTDLTPKTGSGENAGVLGEAIGASNDAGTIYFVANGALSTNEDPSGETAVKGGCEEGGIPSEVKCNLYEWHDGTIRLVAVLSGEDATDWGRELGELNFLAGRVTGSGEWLAFMSNRSLTGYDNRDVRSGERDEEVYLYNSNSESLVCVSCNPTGERPHGIEYKQLQDGLAGGEGLFSTTTWVAANVPGWIASRVGQTIYQSRYLDESGRMFFDSSDSLVPRDTNGQEDVYEYEPAGVGSCKEGGEGYISQDGGCLGLVSSGESGEESGFLDASESGDDVFFLTASQLSKHDTDTDLDVYDARVGGIEPEEAKPVECSGDACQAAVSPPESLTPSSLTSNGPGNLLTPPAPGSNTKTTTTKPKAKTETRQQKLTKALKACRKERVVGRRRACEKKARAVYGARAKKAKRRAG